MGNPTFPAVAPPASSPAKTDSLTVDYKEAGKLLSVSARTVWQLVADGKLPHLKIGRRVLIARSALIAFIERESQIGGAA